MPICPFRWILITICLVSQTRLTARKGDRNGKPADGFFQTALKMLNEEGPQSFYAGIRAALVLVMNPIIQYTVFEQLKNFISKKKTLGNFDFFLLGAISKLAATSITYPYM